jgi:hypothetical protein
VPVQVLLSIVKSLPLLYVFVRMSKSSSNQRDPDQLQMIDSCIDKGLSQGGISSLGILGFSPNQRDRRSV